MIQELCTFDFSFGNFGNKKRQVDSVVIDRLVSIVWVKINKCIIKVDILFSYIAGSCHNSNWANDHRQLLFA